MGRHPVLLGATVSSSNSMIAATVSGVIIQPVEVDIFCAVQSITTTGTSLDNTYFLSGPRLFIPKPNYTIEPKVCAIGASFQVDLAPTTVPAGFTYD